nr:splicing factor u2af large subunit B [Ipomoea batatas]
MGRSSLGKEMNASNNASSQSKSDEGTSARTRPFTCAEIMLRRKNKKDIEEIKDSSVGAAVVLDKENSVNRTFDSLGSDRYCDVSIPSSVRHNSKDSQLTSRREESDDKARKVARFKKKEIRETETKRGEAVSNDTSGKNISGYKIDRAPHGGRTKDDKSNDGSKNKHGNKHVNDLARKDILTDKGSKIYEKERKEKHHDKDSRQVYRKRTNDELPSNASEDESEKRHSRNYSSTNRYKGKNKEKSEKETKRKHQHEDEEKAKDRNADKKHDSSKLRISEFAEKKDSKRSHHEDLRPKRRRSRSRERDKESHRKSRSPSPKAHKHSSHDVRDRTETYSHSSKDKSGRSNSDFDKKRISNNGETAHYKRHSGSASGLGGYSPRKRKSEAAAKTPSPTSRSPERRIAGWDLPPAATEKNIPAPVLSSLPSSSQSVSLSTLESFVVAPGSLFATKPAVFFPNSYPPLVHAVESIQLTQATRPMRTLYVENLPNSASDKDVMECFNKFLLSSGVNRIQGTQPCISCMIHKEKAQALLEFLTPEDASAALFFDGRSFCGSILKIRRPKDFVEVGTGVAENSVAAVDRTSDAVMDSPHKIFIGGISEVISSEMLMEIAKAFGHLKAYRFVLNGDLNEPCAFLEYADHSVTAKACAGLNGMKLGGKVLTVVQAIPDASLVGNVEHRPYYGIPEHAKPLLESPTEVLKLKNVFDPMGLSEQELEEMMEDIRLECARFGTVKSINVTKQSKCPPTLETVEAIGNGTLTKNDHKTDRVESLQGSTHFELEEAGRLPPLKTNEEPMEAHSTDISKRSCDDKAGITEPSHGSEEDGDASKLVDNPIEDKPAECLNEVSSSELAADHSNDYVNPAKDQVEIINRIDSPSSAKELQVDDELLTKDDLKSNEYDRKLEASSDELESSLKKDSDAPPADKEIKETDHNLEHIFEPGCVLIEYRRAEASSMAAHCLHGRVFDDRIVSVEYVAHDLYLKKFCR